MAVAATKTERFTFDSVELDSLSSGNGNNRQRIKRMMLQYKDTDLWFAINPSDYTQKYPNRANLTQTKGGAWIDAWGKGIVEINIKGVTGVSGNKYELSSTSENSSVDEGYQRWKKLRNLFISLYESVKDGETLTRDDLIKLYNFTDNEYWYCYPMPQGIELYRSKSKPHMYQYTINLWGVAERGSPEEETGVIGNPNYVESVNQKVIVDNGKVSENSIEDTAGTNEIPPGEAAAGENPDDSSVSKSTNNDSTLTQQTTSDSTYTAQGGTSYKTKTASINSEVDVTVQTVTKTKSTYDLRNHSEKLAKQLAPIVGGYKGLLVPPTAYQTAKDLNLTELGIVLNVDEFTKANLIRAGSSVFLPRNRLLEEIRFVPLVSPECYKLGKKILGYSPEVLTPEFSNPIGSTPSERIKQTIALNRYFGSTLYEYVKQYQAKYYLTQVDTKYLKMILLETMTLYYHLYKIINSTGKVYTQYTLSNIDVLIKNIQAVIIYLQFNNDEATLFYIRNVMWELRKIESLLHQIRTYVLEYL